MSDPAVLAERDRYEAFASRVTRSGIVTDPWLDGVPRLAPDAVVVSRDDYAALSKVAEDVGELYDEACRLVDDDDSLLDDFFGLTPVQKLMWESSRPLWHGIARADVFSTDEGWVITELNSDTPTGEAEAVVLGELASEARDDVTDPNERLEERFGEMVDVLVERLTDGDGPRALGIVYPTEFTDDLALVRLYRRWAERRGFAVVLGSPYNLGLDDDGRATLFGAPLSAIVRHYKTDWWGERQSAWDDEALADELPLAEPLRAALTASVSRKTAIINPFGAVVPQNKRCMAFMWEHIHRFSTRGRGLVERFVPYTSRLETLHPEQLLAEREAWVLKSDYGAEGDEVVVGRHVDDDLWRRSLAHARPGRWIAQRHFDAREPPSLRRAVASEGAAQTNLGVFLVGGRASGLYVRRQCGPTDDHALSVPVLVDRGAEIGGAGRTP